MASIKIHEGKDIFTALSHTQSKPDNKKIGNLAQTWHLTEEKPSQAYVNGHDLKVCFDCGLASKAGGGNGACYVVLIHGPDAVWRGSVDAPVSEIPKSINKGIRFGAYGDPVVMPIATMKKLAKAATGHLGYTHQWRNVSPKYAEFLMASVEPTMGDPKKVKQEANKRGYRTYRTLAEGELPMADEVMCPNVTHGIQCDKCMLCGGTSTPAKNVCIPGHGSGKGAFG
tara:strand:+ start:652 stop:1332 length:681 start_codon:yes stop_codon:yes gene_type:complete